jgi:hypothetical protein
MPNPQSKGWCIRNRKAHPGTKHPSKYPLHISLRNTTSP